MVSLSSVTLNQTGCARNHLGKVLFPLFDLSAEKKKCSHLAQKQQSHVVVLTGKAVVGTFG